LSFARSHRSMDTSRRARPAASVVVQRLLQTCRTRPSQSALTCVSRCFTSMALSCATPKSSDVPNRPIAKTCFGSGRRGSSDPSRNDRESHLHHRYGALRLQSIEGHPQRAKPCDSAASASRRALLRAARKRLRCPQRGAKLPTPDPGHLVAAPASHPPLGHRDRRTLSGRNGAGSQRLRRRGVPLRATPRRHR
jgi:hypothetical protein